MNFDKHRTTRFVGSIICLMLICTIIGAMGLSLKTGLPIAIGFYFAYLLTASCLLSWLATRLFRQHEMRKLKFDIGSMIILTTMIALPLGFNSVFQTLARDLDRETHGLMLIFLPILLYFSLFPILLVLEALLVWTIQLRKKTDPRDGKT